MDQREIGRARARPARVVLQQLGEPGDRLQRIVQLVGDAGDEHADRREPFLPDHLLLQRLQLVAHAPLFLDLARDRFARRPEVVDHVVKRVAQMLELARRHRRRRTAG